MNRLEKAKLFLTVEQVKQWQFSFMSVIKRIIEENDKKVLNSYIILKQISKELSNLQDGIGSTYDDPNMHAVDDNIIQG